MSITLEHGQVFVTGDSGDLHSLETHFKKTAGGFVAQIMETQIFDLGVFTDTGEGLGDGITPTLIENEEASDMVGLLLYHLDSFGRKRYFPIITIFSVT